MTARKPKDPNAAEAKEAREKAVCELCLKPGETIGTIGVRLNIAKQTAYEIIKKHGLHEKYLSQRKKSGLPRGKRRDEKIESLAFSLGYMESPSVAWSRLPEHDYCGMVKTVNGIISAWGLHQAV